MGLPIHGPLFFKQYQWQFNVAMYNVFKEHMHSESAFEVKKLMKFSILYNQIVFSKLTDFDNLNMNKIF